MAHRVSTARIDAKQPKTRVPMSSGPHWGSGGKGKGYGVAVGLCLAIVKCDCVIMGALMPSLGCKAIASIIATHFFGDDIARR